MEKRLLLAFVLSAVIFAVWSVLFPPPKPPRPVTPPAHVAATPLVENGGGAAAEQAPAAEPPSPTEVEASPEAITAGAEESVRLGNDVLELIMSNRGAMITSLVLRRYTGDEGQPLELVQTVADPRHTLPLQLVSERGPDEALYRVACAERTCRFEWADGLGSRVIKTVTVPAQGYGIEADIERRGPAASWAMSVGTGLRDRGKVEKENRFSTWGDVVVEADGKLERLRRQKLKEEKEIRPQTVGFAGFEDTYFLNTWRPATPISAVRVERLEINETNDKGQEVKEPVLEVLLVPKGPEIKGELFAAPKEYDLLQKVDHGLDQTLHFGFFHPISVFFLKALRWIYAGVGNWGLAIILLTLAIRVVLFPLMHTSTVSMRKMQRVQPKVKAIQEKYKKHKGDAQAKAKMNQEMMELYKIEGVNPMGGCLPMLVQLPILWALYTLFAYAIELRHAPFIFWIHDLSTKDPYYVTPILMTATMWLQQRLAPQAGDPQQQKIFRMMPLIFGIMFLGFPSGLVLYWLTNNVITILQQEITLHLIGERSLPRRGRSAAKGKER
jgi:YidC/Oxa1 family membrane protein insertase